MDQYFVPLLLHRGLFSPCLHEFSQSVVFFLDSVVFKKLPHIQQIFLTRALLHRNRFCIDRMFVLINVDAFSERISIYLISSRMIV